MKKFTLLFACLVGWGSLMAQGQVFETRTVRSEILNADRHYSIYLPECYNKSDKSYPVLYLLHGSGDNHTGWVQFGQVQNIADKVIAEGLAGPMIIVMPDASTGVRGYFNSTERDFRYEDFFFEELIPHIEKTYRVRGERRYRAVAGLSMGGGGTLFYALRHPEMFAAAAPLSASAGNWDSDGEFAKLKKSQPNASDAQLLKSINSVPEILNNIPEEHLRRIKSVRWYASCGDDDFLYEGNDNLHTLFRQKEIPHEFRVKDGGHTWTYWRMELPLVMEFVSKSFMQF